MSLIAAQEALVRFCVDIVSIGVLITSPIDSTSIHLADGTLHFELKGIKCAHDKKDSMLLLTYIVMGEEYTENMLIQTLSNTHKKRVHSLTRSSVRKEIMLKKELVVKITLECPPYGEFKQYKKSQPQSRYKTTNKKDPHIQYTRKQKQAIKEILIEWTDQHI